MFRYGGPPRRSYFAFANLYLLFDEITIIPWLKLTYVFDPQIFMEKHKEKRDELLFSSNIQSIVLYEQHMPLSHIFAPKFKASGHCSYVLFLMFHVLHTFEIEEFLMFSVILHTYTTVQDFSYVQIYAFPINFDSLFYAIYFQSS